MTELIAREAPWFETRTLCYHPNTYGFIIGEIIRRVTGQNIHDFGEAELFGPLGADFHFQLDAREFGRVASLTHDDKPFPFEEGSIPDRAMSSVENPPEGTDIWETPERMGAIMPGSNNYTNARSLAKIGSVMTAEGTVGGHTFLLATPSCHPRSAWKPAPNRSTMNVRVWVTCAWGSPSAWMGKASERPRRVVSTGAAMADPGW
jgi:CubicO group peptidase (beta-lactamase class C family)